MKRLSKLNNKLLSPKLLQASSSITFEAIGTNWIVDIYESISSAKHQTLKDLISARIAAFDRAYSRFRANSLVSQISKSAGRYDLPADSVALVQLYRKLYDTTDGLVTPLIGNLLEDSGYDAEYSFVPKTLRPVPAWDTVLSFDGCRLTTTTPVTLDFGAAGKGYLVDIVGELLEVHDINRYCVNAGGDIRFRHPTKPLIVGLEHPDDPTRVIGTVELRNQSICASATNRRAWRHYHHVMDPKTLNSTDQVRATWVVAASTMLADGIATALFFVNPERLTGFGPFDYAVIGTKASGATIVCSDFFTERLF